MAARQMSDAFSDTGSVPTEEQQTLNLVHQLLRSFQYGRSHMVFACGGTVPIPVSNNTAQQSSTTLDAAATCQPVILRWDPQSQHVPARVCKLQFPLDGSDSATMNNIQQLFEDMQPATFGYQGQDVLDESYRKASKLDPSHFDCTFNPYEMGIIDEVAQILLPGVKRKNASNNNSNEGVNVMRAELYKLNVYSGPSGHFKAHVDTPRSNEQIGSLVVCLPSAHQGGQLEVCHQGRIMKFDWSMPETARPEIHWAAFYSDCQHEVMEVKSGHRITLTYNLYARNTSSTDAPQAGRGLMDPTQLPLHGILHSLFLKENFMPRGGYLGVHTSHAYPHTSTSACLPATLKGADMVAWETFRTLGCEVKLRPVVELAEWYHYGHESKGEDEYGYEDEDEDEDDCPTVERNPLFSLPSSDLPGLGTPGIPIPQPEDDSEDNKFDPAGHESRRNAGGCRVLGNNLRFHKDRGFPVENNEYMQRLLEEWMDRRPGEPKGPTAQPKRVLFEEVSWLNRSGPHREPQIAYAAVSCP